jgi:hypothetical protein
MFICTLFMPCSPHPQMFIPFALRFHVTGILKGKSEHVTTSRRPRRAAGHKIKIELMNFLEKLSIIFYDRLSTFLLPIHFFPPADQREDTPPKNGSPRKTML